MSYPKEQVEFLQACYEMRVAQNRYFRHKNDQNLRIAKRKEAAFDKLLEPYITAGVITAKEPIKRNPSPTLFDNAT